MVRSVAINVSFESSLLMVVDMMMRMVTMTMMTMIADDGNDYMMMTVMTFDGLQDCGRNPAEDTNLAPLAPA